MKNYNSYCNFLMLNKCTDWYDRFDDDDIRKKFCVKESKKYSL